MERTLLVGDSFLADVTPFTPRRGDVITFLFPEDRTRVFIKRVVGLPGETVEVRGRAVLVNGRPLDEPYARFIDALDEEDDPPGRRGWGPHTVPAGHLFVLGDNRDNSRDSRFWGFLPTDQVKGRALIVYWSYEASRDEYHRTGYGEWVKDTLSAFTRTRWDRFFHMIR